MARIPIRDVGRIGLVSDISAHELPPNAWNRAENVVFRDNAAFKAKGIVDSVFGELPITPYAIFYAPSTLANYWILCGSSAVYSYDGTFADITRTVGAYTGGATDTWTGGWLNGVMILNNKIDLPQAWAPIDAATPLVNLPNWPVNKRAKVVRPYKNFLMALNITDGTTNYPTMVMWSHPADPGAVPPSWDETDPSYLAGNMPLSETSGEIVDGLAMGDTFVIYKEDAIINLQFIGGQSIFRQQMKSGTVGIAAVNCVQEFKPGLHILLTQDADVVIYNGQTVESILTGRAQKQLLNRLAEPYLDRSFVTVNRRQKEVWICVPTGEATYPNYAMIWNWQTGQFGELFMDECAQVGIGAYTPSEDSGNWDDLVGDWDDMTGTWDGGTAANTSGRMLGAFPNANDVRLLSEGYSNAGTSIESVLERTGLAVIEQSLDGSLRVDPSMVKLVTGLWPLIEAPDGGTFIIQVGAQDRRDGPITWSSEITFDPASQSHIEPLVEGAFIAVRFKNTSSGRWKIDGYDLEVTPVGRAL